jgi:hypothetical protein
MLWYNYTSNQKNSDFFLKKSMLLFYVVVLCVILDNYTYGLFRKPGRYSARGPPSTTNDFFITLKSEHTDTIGHLTQLLHNFYTTPLT